MQVEEQIKEALLNILQIGLLRIRAFGWEGLSEYCAMEADHLHNIPNLVIHMKTELVGYYYNVERPAFAAKAKNPEAFESEWKRLGEILANIVSSRSTE